MAMFDIDIKDMFFEKFLDANGITMDEFNALDDDKKAEFNDKFAEFAQPLMRDHMDEYIRKGKEADPSKEEDDLMIEYGQLPIEDEAYKDLKEQIEEGIEKIKDGETLNLEQEGQEEEIANWKLRYIEEFQKGCDDNEYDLNVASDLKKDPGLDLEVFEKGADQETAEPIVRSYFKDENNAALAVNSQEGADFAIERYKNLGIKTINLTMKKSDGTEMDPEYAAHIMISCLKNDMNCKFDGKPANFEELGIEDEKIIEEYNKALEEYNARHGREEEPEKTPEELEKEAKIAELRARAEKNQFEVSEFGASEKDKETHRQDQETKLSEKDVELAKEQAALLNKGRDAIVGKADDDQEKKDFLEIEKQMIDLDKEIEELKNDGKDVPADKEQSLHDAKEAHRLLILGALDDADKAKYVEIYGERNDIAQRRQGRDLRKAQGALIDKGAASLSGVAKSDYLAEVAKMNNASAAMQELDNIRFGYDNADPSKRVEPREWTDDEKAEYAQLSKDNKQANIERKKLAYDALSPEDKKQYDNNQNNLMARSKAFAEARGER